MHIFPDLDDRQHLIHVKKVWQATLDLVALGDPIHAAPLSGLGPKQLLAIDRQEALYVYTWHGKKIEMKQHGIKGANTLL